MATYVPHHGISSEVTLSTKRQVVIPALIARELDLKPGDKLVTWVEDGKIILQPRPHSWVDYIAGSARGLYGSTKEEVDAYISEVRESWEEHARVAEGDSYISEEEPGS